MKEIQNLFDNYADNLSPQPQLSACARQQMTSARLKTRRKFVWQPISAACCVLLVVVFSGVLLHTPSSIPNDISIPNSYSMANAHAKTLQQEELVQVVPLADLSQMDCAVVFEKYFVYRLNGTEEITGYRAIWGVSTQFGIIELDVFAELDGYLREDFRSAYNNFTSLNQQVFMTTIADDLAEYITYAVIQSGPMHIFVAARCNASNVDNAREIISLFA